MIYSRGATPEEIKDWIFDLTAKADDVVVTDGDTAADRAAAAARLRWDSIAKPVRGLGRLEEAVVRLASIQETPDVSLDRKCVVVMCADNGVVREGVTQTGQEVTRIVAENFLTGRTCCSVMARYAGAEVFPVDIGIASESLVENRKVAYGTQDILQAPAMTRQQAVTAILRGAEKAATLADLGYPIVAVGEMGIGNTTTASAVTSVLLGVEPDRVTGRGAGLSDEAFLRKREVIRGAIKLHSPDPRDPVDVLSKVGGLDIAGMAGVFLGCAAKRMAAVADGGISLAAALVAVRLCPEAKRFIFASHLPLEPMGKMLLDELGLVPMIDGNIALGEGAGAVLLFPLLDMALEVYYGMTTFNDIGVENYQYSVNK